MGNTGSIRTKRLTTHAPCGGLTGTEVVYPAVLGPTPTGVAILIACGHSLCVGSTDTVGTATPTAGKITRCGKLAVDAALGSLPQISLLPCSIRTPPSAVLQTCLGIGRLDSQTVNLVDSLADMTYNLLQLVKLLKSHRFVLLQVLQLYPIALFGLLQLTGHLGDVLEILPNLLNLLLDLLSAHHLLFGFTSLKFWLIRAHLYYSTNPYGL